MSKIEKKQMGGRVVTVSRKETKKQPTAEEYVEDTREGRVPAKELVKWFKRTYPGAEPVHRTNGKTYHLEGKKVIKEPYFENKEGVFFGRVLNKLLRVHGFEGMADLEWHPKSEVFKIPPKVNVVTLNVIKKAIRERFPKQAG